MIDWTLAHLRLMWALVGLTFIVMLLIPDARWNAITTVWGALFLGLLISLVLEQRGEGLQRGLWLAQNTGRARATVDELVAVAAQSAAFAVDMPDEIMRVLMSGATRSARRDAAERARAHIWRRMQITPGSEDSDYASADDLLEYARRIGELREQLSDLRHRHRLVLSRTTQLDTALDRLLDARFAGLRKRSFPRTTRGPGTCATPDICCSRSPRPQLASTKRAQICCWKPDCSRHDAYIDQEF